MRQAVHAEGDRHHEAMAAIVREAYLRGETAAVIAQALGVSRATTYRRYGWLFAQLRELDGGRPLRCSTRAARAEASAPARSAA